MVSVFLSIAVFFHLASVCHSSYSGGDTEESVYGSEVPAPPQITSQGTSFSDYFTHIPDFLTPDIQSYLQDAYTNSPHNGVSDGDYKNRIDSIYTRHLKPTDTDSEGTLILKAQLTVFTIQGLAGTLATVFLNRDEYSSADDFDSMQAALTDALDVFFSKGLPHQPKTLAEYVYHLSSLHTPENIRDTATILELCWNIPEHMAQYKVTPDILEQFKTHNTKGLAFFTRFGPYLAPVDFTDANLRKMMALWSSLDNYAAQHQYLFELGIQKEYVELILLRDQATNTQYRKRLPIFKNYLAAYTTHRDTINRCEKYIPSGHASHIVIIQIINCFPKDEVENFEKLLLETRTPEQISRFFMLFIEKKVRQKESYLISTLDAYVGSKSP